MSGTRYRSPAVRRLAEVVDRVAPRDPARWDDRERVPGAGGVAVRVSQARAKQLRMVVAMMDRAVGRPEVAKVVAAGDKPGSRRRLFAPEVLDAFWELAVAGELRQREKDVGKPLPLASQRVVRDCVTLLGAVAAPEVPLYLPVVTTPELKPTVAPRSLEALYRGMVDLAGAGPLSRDGTALSYEDRARLLAMVAILLDAAPRSGELAALRLDDLAVGETAVGVRRRQQKAPANRAEEIAALARVHPETARSVLLGAVERVSEATRQRVLAAITELGPAPEVEWYELREGSRVAVRRWLEVREGLVAGVEGGRSGLWVTLQASKAGPAGVTLRAQGLRQGFARGVTALNWVMAGAYGWEPLPTTVEQIRRSTTVTPLEEPPER